MKRIINFHIGVPGVGERVLKEIFRNPIVGGGRDLCMLISDAEYKSRYKASIEGADNASFQEKIDQDSNGRDVFLSRPKFIQTGHVLSLNGDLRGVTHKLKRIARSGSSHSMCIHVFITDHVSYLGGLAPASLLVDGKLQSAATWVPLIKNLISEVRDRATISVWDFEEEGRAGGEFLKTVVRKQSRSLNVKRDYEIDYSRERALESLGVSAHELDERYRMDLEKINSLGVLMNPNVGEGRMEAR